MGRLREELLDPWGDRLRDVGHEFGTTTGRPRRCGWYDSVITRYASRINGLTDIVLTKLDVLTGIEQIPVCVAYDVDGVRYQDLPLDQAAFAAATPVYDYLPGWTEDISGCREFADLPAAAQDYVRAVEEMSDCRISTIGVGPCRDEIIQINDLLHTR